ncbi:DUF4232 domain-containing protein [Microbacterium oleivorans]|uniref:DUF4232 domain-containing protein n=1 Tax=Microbacterium oleivorans TaxID=273677 RepID=UPI0010A4B1B6|nr:DUF4232 domain-containing protein [Microbacterium oleivorans]THE07397.1 DUF4232 domain-containing protein [Microbacterium oleivorans]
MRRGLIGGGVLVALWFVCGWAPFLLYAAGGSLASLGQMVPSPMARGAFASPAPWTFIVQILVAIALVAVFAVLASRFSSGRATFAAGWLAAILPSFAIGAVLDLGSFFTGLGTFGIRGSLGMMGTTPVTTWWAVALGWIPALAWARLPIAPPAETAPRVRAAGRVPTLAWSAIAAVALICLPLAAQAGSDATQTQLREDEATAAQQADPDGAAAPDPSATGEPVPAMAPAEGPTPADACTSANTTILAPAEDAATGHRGQLLSLVNTSDEPCVVNGYPDVAYGDQNGHLLQVDVQHGSSFMGDDPGAAAITLQPGSSARAVIGWDANSVRGHLAARSLWLAVSPGQERLTWEVSLDIIPGATVHVTAWRDIAPPEG